ncbi:hypothetical protein [Pseudalkalibacillus caeni]|uniref:Uncharacterized protein n=1 Tax=Exobacillus caeni TaxID=2574798 RepID=A0A5R9EZC6_9BACL|nr:hypothetical protein [Pseudalkalibacillus caeni]TLS36191.1 hypothetical protein FCL54_16275 [Pseudalkalibacillus caeni]
MEGQNMVSHAKWKFVFLVFLIAVLSGCQSEQNSETDSDDTKKATETETIQDASYEDRGENIFFIPHSELDVIIESVKMLRREHPNIEIKNMTEVRSAKGGNLNRLLGYIVIGEETEENN